MTEEIKKKKWYSLSTRQIGVAAAFGGAAFGVMVLNITVPFGPGLALDLGEIFVSLGGSLGGPIAGIVVGLLKGLGGAPDRNVPPHMLCGAFMGFWYKFVYGWSTKFKNAKWIRIGIWIPTMVFYYYVLLLPLLFWIYATFTLMVPWWPFFTGIAPLVIPEMIGTIIVTAIIWAALPERYSAPVE